MNNRLTSASLSRRSSLGARCLAFVAMAAVVLSAASCACSVSLLEVQTEVHTLPSPAASPFYPRAVAWTDRAHRVDRPIVISPAWALRDVIITDELRESQRSRVQALVDERWIMAFDPVSFLMLEGGLDRPAGRVHVRGLFVNATGIDIEGFGVSLDIELLGNDLELVGEYRFEIVPLDLGRLRHGEGIVYDLSIGVGEIPLDQLVPFDVEISVARDIWVVPYG